MIYFGNWVGTNRNGSVDDYPTFNARDGVWGLRMSSHSYRDNSWWSELWLWFYDQIGKVPNINVIKPWFWTSNETSTDPWFRPKANGGSALMVVQYVGTTDSVATIQSKYWSDNSQFGGNLRNGRRYISNDKKEWSAGYAEWYASSVISMKPGYSVELSVQASSSSFGNRTWTGQVQLYVEWRVQAVTKFWFDRIEYRPIK